MHNELHNLSSLPNIITTKLRKTRWAERVAPKELVRYGYRILVGKKKGKIPLKRQALLGLGLGLVADSREHGNEPSSSIKGGKLLYYLSDYQLLKDSPHLCLARLSHNLWGLRGRERPFREYMAVGA